MPAVNRTKQIAVMAVLAAFSTVMTVLGTIISINTIFFTALAAFLAGIVLTRYGKGSGVLFFAVCAVLDFLVNPDKIHVLLYIALAGYIVISEFVYCLIRMEDGKKKENVHLVVRLVLFCLLYIPIAWFLPQLLVDQQILRMAWLLPALLVGGLIGWLIFDKAYCVFKRLFMQRFARLF